MVSARSSTPNVSPTDAPVRLAYRLRALGRSQPVKVTASKKAGERGLSESDLKRMQNTLHALDVAISRELRAGVIFGQLSDPQLARLLPLLAQRETLIGGKRLTIEEDELQPRVALQPDPHGGLSMTLSLSPPGDEEPLSIDEGRLLAGAQAFFLVGHIAYPIASPAPWELAILAAEPTQDLSGKLAAGDRDSLVRRLAQAGIPDEDLGLLAVRRGPPDEIGVRVTAAEGTNDNPIAKVSLFAHYGDDAVMLDSQRPPSAFIVPTSGVSGLLERDLAIEEEARRDVRRLGLRWDREQGCFVAKKETALATFDPEAKLFPPGWRVERTDAPSFHRDLRLHTEVKYIEERGLLDLSFDIEALEASPGEDDRVVEALVEMRDLLRWLQTGKKYMRLEDGTYVRPSRAFRQGLMVLDDLGADGRRALVSPLCVGLLRMVGDASSVRAADESTRRWIAELSGSETPVQTEPPEHLAKVLRGYQRRGLDWLRMLHRHHLTGILADDMGLGKTLQTLALLEKTRDEEGPQPSLVVAPTSVVNVWHDEAKRFTPSIRIGFLHGPPKVRHKIEIHDKDLLITSYGVLRRDAERLARIPFRYVILDEAQAAKNAATQNARAVRRLVSQRRLALTGTPIENRSEELWAAFDFLAPGFLGNLRQFRKRYGRPIARGDEGSLALLRARVQPFVLRRLKTEVAKELPPKIETTVRCEMERAQRALYEHIAGTLRDNVQRKVEKVGIERAHLDILAALTRLRQICCDPSLLKSGKGIPKGTKAPPSAKLALFRELMREALASERRVVVFSQFVQMQKRLIAVIKDLGVEPLWLHGGTRNRGKVVDAFQTPSGPPVIVVSLRAGGTGLTLTRADTVMHYDPWWNPAVERQATDRTHRLGQTQRVTVYKLVVKGTIEEKVLAMAARKDKLADTLIASEGALGAKQISPEEVLALLG